MKVDPAIKVLNPSVPSPDLVSLLIELYLFISFSPIKMGLNNLFFALPLEIHITFQSSKQQKMQPCVARRYCKLKLHIWITQFAWHYFYITFFFFFYFSAAL